MRFPTEFTWNKSPDPTVNSEAGLESLMPTFPWSTINPFVEPPVFKISPPDFVWAVELTFRGAPTFPVGGRESGGDHANTYAPIDRKAKRSGRNIPMKGLTLFIVLLYQMPRHAVQEKRLFLRTPPLESMSSPFRSGPKSHIFAEY